MVSDEPLPDRCGAQVTSQLGLNVELGSDPQLVLTDEVIGIVRLEDSADTNTDAKSDDRRDVVEARPNYSSLRKWLWDDYVCTAIGLDPATNLGETEQEHGPVPSQTELVASSGVAGLWADTPPGEDDLPGLATYQAVELDDVDLEARDEFERDDLDWLLVDTDGDWNITNRRTALDGYCEKYPTQDRNTCHLHDTGPNAGPDKGEIPHDSLVDPPTQIKHGLYARRTNYYQSLDDEDTMFIEGMVNSWLEDAPFDRSHAAKMNELYRLAIDQHRAMNALDEYVDEGELEGMTTELTIDFDEQTGEEITTLDEHPVNLPYSRLDRDILKKLSELGITDDDDDDDADVESIAKLLSASTDER